MSEKISFKQAENEQMYHWHDPAPPTQTHSPDIHSSFYRCYKEYLPTMEYLIYIYVVSLKCGMLVNLFTDKIATVTRLDSNGVVLRTWDRVWQV